MASNGQGTNTQVTNKLLCVLDLADMVPTCLIPTSKVQRELKVMIIEENIVQWGVRFRPMVPWDPSRYIASQQPGLRNPNLTIKGRRIKQSIRIRALFLIQFCKDMINEDGLPSRKHTNYDYTNCEEYYSLDTDL